ncbi:MAG: hypothetical protein ACI97P_001222 [Arcticibacterium sp.]|jgi:hypothetical protein
MNTILRLNTYQISLNTLLISIVFNLPLSRIFPNFYYLVVAVFFSYWLVIATYFGKTKIKYISLVFLTYSAFLFGLFIVQILTGSSVGLNSAIKSLVTLLWIPMFYILILPLMEGIDFNKFIKVQIYLALIVGVLGFVQFFGSTTIYGLLPDSKWDKIVEGGQVGLRTYSILNSPQVFGLFCIIYAVITIEYKHIFRRSYIPIAIVIVIFLASLLSGNKSSSVLFIFYIFFKISLNKTILARVALFSVGLVVGSIMIFPPELNNVEVTGNKSIDRSLGWISSFGDLTSDRSNQERLGVYKINLDQLKPFTGNEIGSTAPNEQGGRLITSESYYMKVLMEGGVMGAFLFISFLFLGMRELVKNKRKKAIIIYSLVLLSFVFVEAFASPAFFGIWGYLLFEINKEN